MRFLESLSWKRGSIFLFSNTKKIIFFIFLISDVGDQVYAQYSINKTPQDEQLIASTMDLIYNFEFEAAQKQLAEVKKHFPNHPIYHFLSAMYCYWEMIPITTDNPKYKVYEYHLLKTIELSKTMLLHPLSQQEATFYMIAANSSLIVVLLKNKDYGKAVTEARKTYAYMKDGFEWGDKYPDFNFSSGLYYFFAAQYPETNPSIQPVMWFFSKGDKEKGISLIKKSAEKSLFSKTESDFFLAHVYLKFYNLPSEAIKYTQKLIDKYPNNYFYLSKHTEALVLSKKYIEAKSFAEKLLKNPANYFQISGHLFLGMIELASNNMSMAKKHFETAEKLSIAIKKHNDDYLGFVYWGLGKIYEKENNRKKAEVYFEMLEETGEYKIHKVEVLAYKNRHKLAKKNGG